MSDAVAGERIARRLASEPARAAHADGELMASRERGGSSSASFERISIRAPSLVVDTTDGYAPELAEILAFIDRR